MIDNNLLLIESFDSLIAIIDLVNGDSSCSIKFIEKELSGRDGAKSIQIALNYYYSKLHHKIDEEPIFFASNEFQELGEEINNLLIFLISQRLFTYSKIEEVVERLTIINFTGVITTQEVKRIFATVMFSDVTSELRNFMVN